MDVYSRWDNFPISINCMNPGSQVVLFNTSVLHHMMNPWVRQHRSVSDKICFNLLSAPTHDSNLTIVIAYKTEKSYLLTIGYTSVINV